MLRVRPLESLSWKEEGFQRLIHTLTGWGTSEAMQQALPFGPVMFHFMYHWPRLWCSVVWSNIRCCCGGIFAEVSNIYNQLTCETDYPLKCKWPLSNKLKTLSTKTKLFQEKRNSASRNPGFLACGLPYRFQTQDFLPEFPDCCTEIITLPLPRLSLSNSD